jgi:hypothetical protein
MEWEEWVEKNRPTGVGWVELRQLALGKHGKDWVEKAVELVASGYEFK